MFAPGKASEQHVIGVDTLANLLALRFLGALKCFQRGSGNRIETPTGCYGDGVPSKILLSV